MLFGCFSAGIVGGFWMLLDDMFKQDSCRVRLQDLVPDVFNLAQGTAQGIRNSVHLFNCQMKLLFDLIESASSGVAAWPSRWATEVLGFADTLTRASTTEYGKDAAFSLSQSLGRIRTDIRSISQLVSAEHSAPLRFAALDMLATVILIALQYIDDIVTLASSAEQLCQIWKTCEVFTLLHGARFNIGPRKSAVLLIGVITDTFFGNDSFKYFESDIPVVSSYLYLGVWLDQHLSFVHHFDTTVGRAWREFDSLFGCATSTSLPAPIICLIVPSRIEPIVLYGMELCLQVPQF